MVRQPTIHPGLLGKGETKLMKGVQFSLNKCSPNAKDAKLHKNHIRIPEVT